MLPHGDGIGATRRQHCCRLVTLQLQIRPASRRGGGGRSRRDIVPQQFLQTVLLAVEYLLQAVGNRVADARCGRFLGLPLFDFSWIDLMTPQIGHALIPFQYLSLTVDTLSIYRTLILRHYPTAPFHHATPRNGSGSDGAVRSYDAAPTGHA